MTFKRKLSLNKFGGVSKKTKTNIKTSKNFNNFHIKKYVIYCRVSTKEQSLESQEHSCVKFCKERNFNVSEIIKESCSARKMNSQHKLKKLINENKNITIVVNSVDRFSRNVTDCFKMFDIMKKNKINLVSVTDQIDLNTAYGEHAFRTRVSTAQLESDSISERVRRTINYKKENGLALTSRTSYGYKIINGKKEIDPLEQEVIKFIRKFLSSNRGPVNSEYFSKELYNLLDLFKKPKDYYVPVLFEENNIELKYVFITSQMLADIFNDYNILKRNKYWTKNSIYNVIPTINNISMDFIL